MIQLFIQMGTSQKYKIMALRFSLTSLQNDALNCILKQSLFANHRNKECQMELQYYLKEIL